MEIHGLRLPGGAKPPAKPRVDIFKKKSPGTFFSRILNQISMIFNSLGSDGGLFVLIGKKH